MRNVLLKMQENTHFGRNLVQCVNVSENFMEKFEETASVNMRHV